jgi:hypothetical protein
MTDFFSLFGLTRRPLVDLDKLNETYARKNAAGPTEKSENSVTLNEAFRILANPVSRLDHLLALESADLRDRVISPEVERWFGKVADVVHRFDDLYHQVGQESVHLLRATKLQMLQENLATGDEVMTQLNSVRESLLDELREIDSDWQENQPLPRLAQVAIDLRFTQKWIDELNERKLRFNELS